MAALQELLDEQARIKAELQRMENDDDGHRGRPTGTSATPSSSGGRSSTRKAKPLIERMEKIRNITRAAEDAANREEPDGGQARRSPAAAAPTW